MLDFQFAMSVTAKITASASAKMIVFKIADR